METHCACSYTRTRYRIIGEVRTADSGKLLFQVADNGAEAFILLKPKGSNYVYCCPMSDISCLISGMT